ncbi:MAG: hypothetical protein HYX38_08740 [Rhodospirillales bacterium]|nr:hypothetical protein [Rhodospirillales bacterium]
MTITTTPLNDLNREVYVDGQHVGWVTCLTVGPAPGWTFTARDNRLTNRFPDGVVPMPTWQAALPVED